MDIESLQASAKFRNEGVRAELAAAALELVHGETDSEGRFALWLSVVRWRTGRWGRLVAAPAVSRGPRPSAGPPR